MRDTIRPEAIRQAALELFAERGYQATTMADIGAALGIRAPSLYKHVASKQDLLAEIMRGTMRSLIRHQQAVISAGGDPAIRLGRMVEAHVRYHAAHRQEAFVGNREIRSLDDRNRASILALRADYEQKLRAVIEEGSAAGLFNVQSPRLSSYAILDMGVGVSAWFRPDAEHSSDEIAYIYANHALRLVGVHEEPPISSASQASSPANFEAP